MGARGRWGPPEGLGGPARGRGLGGSSPRRAADDRPDGGHGAEGPPGRGPAPGREARRGGGGVG